MTKEIRINIIKKVTIQNIILNAILSLIKISVGFFANSFSLVTDGLYNASDIVTTVISLISAKITGRPRDIEQQHNHERNERMNAVTSLILGVIIGFIAIYSIIVSFSKLTQIIGYANDTVEIWVVPVIVVTMLIKGYMYIITKSKAEDIKATALLAVSAAFKMDIFISTAVLLGILSTFLINFYIESINAFYIEPIVALSISVVILKSAFNIIRIAFAQMADKPADSETTEELRAITTGFDGVIITKMQTRQIAYKLYIDMEITVDKSLTVKQGYDIEKSVKKAIENAFPEVKHCMVQVDLTDEDTAPDIV